MKYLELISQDKEKKNQAELEIRAKEAEIETDRGILEIRKALSEAKSQLQAAMSSKNFDLGRVLSAQDEVKAFTEALERAQAIKAELFGE